MNRPAADQLPAASGAPQMREAPAVVRIALGVGALLIVLWTLRAISSWGSDAVDGVFTDGVFLILYAPAVVVCAARAVRVREERFAWMLLSAALVASAGGFLAYSLFVAGVASASSPSIADVSWLAYYPLAFAGLIVLVRRRVGFFGRRLLLDGLIAALALAAVSAAVLVGPIVAASGETGGAVATNLAYPLGDLQMAALVVTVFALTGWRRDRGWLLLGAGFVVAALGDAVNLYQTANGTYMHGTALDAVWPAMALLVAASAWVRVPRRASTPRGSWAMLVAPLAFTAVALAILVYDRLAGLGALPTGLAIAALIASQVRAFESFVTLRRLDRDAIRGPLDALLAALEARDHYTGAHSETVVELATGVARRLHLPYHELLSVQQVGLLHDIGKIGIPDSILRKSGPLDDAEWELMRQHPVIGAKIVSETDSLAYLAPLVRAEHERWDGTGYPDGLRGEQIPLASRIIFACDAFHAMTSDRPYRRAMPVREALHELERNAGIQFDPAIVNAVIDETCPESERHLRATAPVPTPQLA